MKKFKIKKCMTSFLMLVVMVVSIIGVMPKTIAYASASKFWLKTAKYSSEGVEYKDSNGVQYTYSYDCDLLDTDKLYAFYDSTKYGHAGARGEIVLIGVRDISNGGSAFKSMEFTGKCDNNDKESHLSTENVYSYSKGSRKYSYIVFYGNTDDAYKTNATQSYSIFYSSLLEKYGQPKVYEYLLKVAIHEIDDSEFVMEAGNDTSEDLPGTSVNPIRDKNVGYPDIYDYQFLIVKPKPLTGHFDNTDGDYDKLKNADYFKWKSKSTTGFSLTSPSDEYKNVYIQTKIVSKFKYNDKLNGKGEWHNYDNYGEVGYLPFVSASEKKLSVSFQQLTETLPKTFMETHNFKYQYQDYDYYFRIVYTRADDLKVIPTYYSGGWRRVSLHSNNGKHDENGEGDNSSAVIEDGDDDGGEWKKDEDSKDNDKNIDNGTTDGNDLDDAADNADNKNNSSSSGLNINNIRGFMNQIGNVPKAIGKLFTFLPDWVQQFIGFGFVVLVALMIIKAIRG